MYYYSGVWCYVLLLWSMVLTYYYSGVWCSRITTLEYGAMYYYSGVWCYEELSSRVATLLPNYLGDKTALLNFDLYYL